MNNTPKIDHLYGMWIFSLWDTSDIEYFIDEVGGKIEQSDAVPMKLTEEEALAEADRRSDLWEKNHNAIVLRAKRHLVSWVKGENV